MRPAGESFAGLLSARSVSIFDLAFPGDRRTERFRQLQEWFQIISRLTMPVPQDVIDGVHEFPTRMASDKGRSQCPGDQ